MSETVVHFLREAARQRPDADAVVYKGRRVKYHELWNMVCSVADYLRSNGLKENDRVGVLVENSPEYIASYYGVLAAGGVAVGLNTAARAADIANWLEHCGARFLFSSLHHAELGEISEICASDLTIVGIGSKASGPVGISCLWSDIINNRKTGEPDLSIISDVTGPAAIIYTSGTTGSPKGVTLSHKNLLSNTQSIVEYLRLSPKDSIVCVLPFYYSYGNSVMHTHLAVGGMLVLENSFLYPHKVLEKIVEEKVTGFSGVPSTYALLLSRTKLGEYDFSGLRYMTQAGGAMAPASIRQLLEAIPSIDFYVMYGQTEATARLSYLPPDKLLDKMGSIGKAIPGVALEIRDENGSVCPPGVTGEIYARGDNIMTGYWNAPEATNNAIKNGWLSTGDLAHYDEDGYIYIDGRFTDMIKVGANRISPKEIEEKVAELDGIEELAAIGVPDKILGQIIKLFVVKTGSSEITERNILKHCKENMAPYKLPKRIEFVESLPKTASGKLQRFKLLDN